MFMRVEMCTCVGFSFSLGLAYGGLGVVHRIGLGGGRKEGGGRRRRIKKRQIEMNAFFLPLGRLSTRFFWMNERRGKKINKVHRVFFMYHIYFFFEPWTGPYFDRIEFIYNLSQKKQTRTRINGSVYISTVMVLYCRLPPYSTLWNINPRRTTRSPEEYKNARIHSNPPLPPSQLSRNPRVDLGKKKRAVSRTHTIQKRPTPIEHDRVWCIPPPPRESNSFFG